MRYVIGIDLGSTTTKAVVFAEDGRVLGRGITNTRSNYDVACGVARTEALITGRFAVFQDLLRSRLESNAAAAAGESPDSLLPGIRDTFRLVQYLSQLEVLREEIAKAAGTGHWHAHGEKLSERALAILAKIEEEAPSQFDGARQRSEFFRDRAGGRYRVLAQDKELARSIGFDDLLAAFDKAIVQVENRAHDLSFEGNVIPAVESFLERRSLSQRLARAVRGAAREAARTRFDEVARVGTGYGRQKLPFAKAEIRSEILCHGLGAHWMFPRTRTVLDIGGQDTKAIQVNESGVVTSFQMNDRCAAGCGRYLGYIADEMNLPVQDLGPLASESRRRVKINSTCTVFAGAELRDRLSAGQRREDVVAGLHRAIVLRAMSLLARSGGVFNEFTFTGGVASNCAAVAALRDLVRENYGEITLNISPDSIYTGACGAGLFALRAAGSGALLPASEVAA